MVTQSPKPKPSPMQPTTQCTMTTFCSYSVYMTYIPSVLLNLRVQTCEKPPYRVVMDRNDFLSTLTDCPSHCTFNKPVCSLYSNTMYGTE